MITVKRLSSGYVLLRGRGPCNFAQPPFWPCNWETLLTHAFPEASETFLHDCMRSVGVGAVLAPRTLRESGL